MREKLAKLPRHWQKRAAEKHAYLVKTASIYEANNYLLTLTEPLNHILDIAADDDDIKTLANDLSFKVRERMSGALGGNTMDYMQELCISYGVRYPVEFDRPQIVARLTCNVWWLRKLRHSHARAREIAAIDAGLVSRKASIYCSDDTLERRFQQLRRNELLLDDIELKSESGQRMKLKDIAAAGVSNPDNRRAELMTRISGFEELATMYGHKAEFITVTCPSHMHPVTKDGKANPKFDNNNPVRPDAAQRYLVECWARVRAKLAREEVRFYGLRVAEPHHDATPHWHLILFYKPLKNQLEKIRAAFREHFLADAKELTGQDKADRLKNGLKFVSINPLKGSAAGYVAKYVAKNIGGIEGEASDEAGDISSEAAYKRVEAWASTWRIRQFQQIGGHSVTVWRELRRVEKTAAELAGNNILKAWNSAQKTAEKKASFAAFIESMGGLNMPPRESRICCDVDFVTKRGRYGEAINRLVRGVRERFGMMKAENNRETWERV